MLHIHKGPATVIVINGKSSTIDYEAALRSAHGLLMDAAVAAMKDNDPQQSDLYVAQAARLWNLRGAFENSG